MRKAAWIIVMIVMLMGFDDTILSNPRPDPGTVMSIVELEQCLNDSLVARRSRGARQLAGLSKDYRWLMIKAIESPYEDVRLAGINALSVIGDKESTDLLCEYLMEVRDNRDLAIGTAEALSRLKVYASIPLLHEVLSTNNDEYVQEYLARSVDRLETPGLYVPLLEAKFGMVRTNFLIEDVKNVYFEDSGPTYKKHRPHYFKRDEWERIFTLIRRSEVCVDGSFVIRKALVIELNDGRKAEIHENKGSFHYMNDSYFFHSNNEILCFNNQDLTEYIERSGGTE